VLRTEFSLSHRCFTPIPAPGAKKAKPLPDREQQAGGPVGLIPSVKQSRCRRGPARFTRISSRDLFNFDVTYTEPDDRWSLSLYGRNVTNEKYDNARLLPTDYVLIILNNDLSEFGLHYVYNFGG
jgi:hypothetical protein